MRGSRRVQLWQCFQWGGRGSKKHWKRASIGPPAKRHLNGVSLTCRWWPNIECWLGGFVIFRGSWPALLRNPICLWLLGGLVRTPCPFLWIRTWFNRVGMSDSWQYIIVSLTDSWKYSIVILSDSGQYIYIVTKSDSCKSSLLLCQTFRNISLLLTCFRIFAIKHCSYVKLFAI